MIHTKEECQSVFHPFRMIRLNSFFGMLREMSQIISKQTDKEMNEENRSQLDLTLGFITRTISIRGWMILWACKNIW